MRSSASGRGCLHPLLLGTALGVSALVSPSLVGLAEARADVYDEPRPEAIEAHDQGVKQFDAGDYPAALASFQKAYDLSPTFQILYNIGRASRRTGDYKRSLEAFETYLKDGGDRIKEERRADVEKTIEELKALIGSLDITVNVEGAQIYVDDVGVGTSPLAAPVRVNAGPHRVKVTFEGADPEVRDVDVTGGSVVPVEFELEVDQDVEDTPEPDTPTGLPGSTWPSEVTIALWVATAAFAVGAGVTGTIAIVSSNDLETMRYAGPNLQPPPDSDIRGTSERVDTMAQVTNWLIAGAVVTGVSALYLTIAGATEPEGPPSAGASVGIGPGGISLRGSF